MDLNRELTVDILADMRLALANGDTGRSDVLKELFDDGSTAVSWASNTISGTFVDVVETEHWLPISSGAGHGRYH